MYKFTASLIVAVIMLGLVLGCGERMTKEQMFALAEKNEKEEKFTDALKIYEKIAKKYDALGSGDQALYKIAYIYSNNLNDFNASVEAHNRLIAKYPESKFAAQSLFMIGFIYANNLGDFDKAKEYYNKFLGKYPESELVPSVQWELDHLGQDINDIPFLKQNDTSTKSEEKAN